MMDFNDSSNFPAFLHKVSSNYLAPQCSTWQHFGVAQASQKIHMRQTSHCPHSKPAWSQESSITIKSYKIIQFWQTLKIYWLIWLIFVHFLVIFRISWPSTVSRPAFPGAASALPAAADPGAAGALRHADGWPPFGTTTSSLLGVLVGEQDQLKN